MQEDKENTDWTDKTDGEQENREESSLQGSPVGKLITHNLLWHIPSQEQTGDERPQRHEQLGSKVVTIAQEILAEEAQIRYGTLRERTEYSYDAANDGLEPGSLGTAYLTLLINKGGTYLVHRDGRSQGCQYKQSIEQHRNHITDNRHVTESLLEYVWQGNEDERRTCLLYTSDAADEL